MSSLPTHLRRDALTHSTLETRADKLGRLMLPPLGQRERLHGPEAQSQRCHKAQGQGLPRPKGTVQKRYPSLPHTQANTTAHTYHLRVLLAFHSAVPMTLVHLALNLCSERRKEMRMNPVPLAFHPAPTCVAARRSGAAGPTAQVRSRTEGRASSHPGPAAEP